MSKQFRFTHRDLTPGSYEPEGIYLTAPCASTATVAQLFGERPDFYGGYQYNGLFLRGYPGLGLIVPNHTQILAADGGRVSEISIESGGFERYVKIDHPWGESFYALLDDFLVQTGQRIERSQPIALSSYVPILAEPRFHFGIRINPYHRFDGWGGFTDPLPFLDPESIQLDMEQELESSYEPLPMAVEMADSRRP